jgi:hypothetical protein
MVDTNVMTDWRARKRLCRALDGGQCPSRPANLSLFLFIFLIRQASGSERLVGRRERLRERGKRTMTGRVTDCDAAQPLMEGEPDLFEDGVEQTVGGFALGVGEVVLAVGVGH